MLTVQRENRQGQNYQRNGADNVRRLESVKRKHKSRGAGKYGGPQKNGRPTVKLPGIDQGIRNN
jgi:hypothetical protein